MAGRTGRPVLLGAAVVAVVAALTLLVGCGAPSWTYVTNSADRTYLKVPTSWKQVDPAQVASQLGVESADDSSQGVWIEAYDSDAQPSLNHIIGEAAESPAILVTVQPIPEESRGQISLDTVRDFIYPVSQSARQQMQLGGAASGLTGFTLLGDEVLTPGDGIRGVHSVFSYRVNGGEPQIFDQTGYLNDDASKLYLALARCSVDCFEKRQSEIDGVVSSFTVREGP
ncbi:hypothetical protein [Pseudonocardia oroxyli]|uniref:Lipoprotein LpqN n=1 Tax=Pseudonocardia oroxyli TaxID=366584 RepID=A0A1G7L730_PSEOR|nr:hypothetical protein [Pseudonocardia oroxyli]SDF45176.1 hypothetical protein SAMN05216377_1053 [Pseudonocardia oroxyli]